jgi:hypothetical protein
MLQIRVIDTVALVNVAFSGTVQHPLVDMLSRVKICPEKVRNIECWRHERCNALLIFDEL